MPDGKVGLEDVGRVFRMRREDGHVAYIAPIKTVKQSLGAKGLSVQWQDDFNSSVGIWVLDHLYVPLHSGLEHDPWLRVPGQGFGIEGYLHEILDITDRLTEFPDCKLVPPTTAA